jgi:NAD(P)-dependent dehydrogenase (short-subunit alcohol dehydrogenase family)
VRRALGRPRLTNAQGITRVRLDGKVAIVTGSTRGIGKVIARRFAGAGASVVVVGRTVDRGARVVQEIRGDGGRAQFVAADLAREQEVEHLVDEVARSQGRVDVVVNNAAATDLVDNERPVVEQTTAGFDHFVRAGLYSSFWMFKYAIPAMSDGGTFVSISSVAATISRPAEPSYAAAKGGLNALARQVAVDYGPRGIRSNVLMLGFIRTNASAPLLDEPIAGAMVREATPGPVADSDAVASAALLLSCDEGRGFNGAVLVLDGGMTAKSPMPTFQ